MKSKAEGKIAGKRAEGIQKLENEKSNVSKVQSVKKVGAFKAEGLKGKELSAARSDYSKEKLNSRISTVNNGSLMADKEKSNIRAAQESLNAQKGKIKPEEFVVKQAKLMRLNKSLLLTNHL